MMQDLFIIKNLPTDKAEGADSEPVGPLVGLASGDDPAPIVDDRRWLPPISDRDDTYVTRTTPWPVPEGAFLCARFQRSVGLVEDRYARPDPSRGVYDFGQSKSFRGWLKGFKRGVKRFFLRSAAPDGPLERVTLQSVAREAARMETEEPRGGAVSPGAAYREGLCRDAFYMVIEDNFLPAKEEEGNVWPSSGDEPAPHLPRF